MGRPGTPADTSTLIYLAKADLLREARAVVGVLMAPPAVWREAVEVGERRGETDAGRIRAAHDEALLRRVEVPPAAARAAAELASRYRLGRGESEVLVIARRGQRVLMDDGRTARVATALGYVPISAMFLPVLGCQQGLFESAKAIELLRVLASVVAVRADAYLRLEAAILETRS